MDQEGSKHVVVSGFCNIIVNLIQFCAFVGLNYSNWITVIESRWGRDFPHLSRPALYNEYRIFPGVKVRPGRDADPSPPSSAEVKNRVELYLCSP